jgi:hypothetical protein
MNLDLIKEPQNSTGNSKQEASNMNFTCIPATTAPRIFWHTSGKR